MKLTPIQIFFIFLLLIFSGSVNGEENSPGLTKYRSISGIYPHLASFNNQGECGTGAIVPWAGKLWWVTYAPHQPKGSDDKLYALEADGSLTVFSGSIGGTPANRMIHRESQQLFIGPYVINTSGAVRTIPFTQMYGRHTGNARHLSDPANKIYFATMEEGIYEVDVHTLSVKELWRDEQLKDGHHSDLPGYHGKGFYSGFGRLIYANNGEHGKEAQKFPFVPSGVLASWDGKADSWNVVRRNQFTEVTGPGGIYGNEHPERDPVWSIGWDHKSLILMCLYEGQWHTYRLPKGSHSYDGAHGWNTEWPRIRDVGEKNYLMTMHGTFWDFPPTFTPKSSAGIRPRSNYLKVIGDFCRYGDHIVLGCDDTAKSEFLNTRKLKKDVAGPGQSQSNLRFIKPEELDQIGPALGRGAVWIKEDVSAGTYCDPYMCGQYDLENMTIHHESDYPIILDIEVDFKGTNEWQKYSSIDAPAHSSRTMNLNFQSTVKSQIYLPSKINKEEISGQRMIQPNEILEVRKEVPAKPTWIRFKPTSDAKQLTVQMNYKNQDSRTPAKSMHAETTNYAGGLLHIRGENLRTLRIVPEEFSADTPFVYDLDERLELTKVTDLKGGNYVREKLAYPQNVITVDEASVLYIDEQGKRWRLPKGDLKFDAWMQKSLHRVCREVATERDLLNVHGTFYELPAENAGGFAKIRAISTHNQFIQDYATYRGMLVLSGINNSLPDLEKHLIKSADGKIVLWVGSIDDTWNMGKPVGKGGPWMKSKVTKGIPSDPYLLTGYDQKFLSISHDSPTPVEFILETDITGDGLWINYPGMTVNPGEVINLDLGQGNIGYWARLRSNADTTASAEFDYK